MARKIIQTAGQLIQYTGPFDVGESFSFGNNILCKIGISIEEKDYMFESNPDPNNDNGSKLLVNINGKVIKIGRTFIYEPGDILKGVGISFPNGAPKGTKLDIILIPQ